MAEPTIAAGFANGLIELAVSMGASQKALVERSQIDPADLEDQDNRIPLKNYLILLEAGVELLEEPALALKFGEAFSIPQLSIVGLIGQASETVEEAFMQMNRYVRLMIDDGENANRDWFTFVKDDDGAWLTLNSELYIEHPQLAESALARWVAGSAREPGYRPFAQAIHFTHKEPSYRAEYDRIFGLPIVFGSDKNAILVNRKFLSLKINPSNRYVFGILSARANALLEELEDAESVRGQVEKILIPILHTGDLKMERIARMLGVSRRTLYRKLKAEGVGYEKILDDLRHQLALHYLNGKKATVNETAYLVGFSDPSAFSRAFKRWTGNSPRKMLAKNE